MAKPVATKLGTHVHPLDLSIVGAKQLDAATANGCAAIADEKEGHAFRNQLLHTVAMTAFTRIERLKVRLKLGNQGCRVRSVRTFRRYDGWHTSLVNFLSTLRCVATTFSAAATRSSALIGYRWHVGQIGSLRLVQLRVRARPEVVMWAGLHHSNAMG